MILASPWMLLALGALAVPIAVHLVAREPPGGTAFPSLMFLSRIPVRERRQRTLRDRALLGARCLALALLALAFAGPHLTAPDAVPTGDSGIAVAVVVDRSASMGYAGRWERARAAAEAALGRADAGGAAALVLFDTRHEVVSGDAGALRAALAAARPGDGATDLGGALEAGGRWLADRPAARRELVLVSDLQRSGLGAGRTIRLPAGVNFETVAVAGGDAGNAALVHAEALPAGDGPRLRIAATIRHTAGPSAAVTTVTLTVDGQAPERRAVELAAGASARVAFEVAAPVSRAAIARLSLSPDGLAADDVRHLVLAPEHPLEVLVLGESSRPGPSGQYLARALEVTREPTVTVRFRAARDADQALLAGADVIVLDDGPVAGPFVQALDARVRAGAGLLVLAGEGLRGAWPGGADGLVPGALGAARSATAGPSRLVATPGLPDGLEASAIWRHRDLAAAPGDRVILALSDGAPLGLERTVGAGRAIAIATTLDTRWSSLAREPGFVALARDLMVRLAGREGHGAPLAYLVGAAVSPLDAARSLSPAAAARLEAGAPASVRSPSGRETRLSGDTPLTLQEAGIHTVHVGEHAFAVAANVDPAESDLGQLDAGDLATLVVTEEATQAGVDAGTGNGNADTMRWWWRLLVLATILLLAESWFANRTSTVRANRIRGERGRSDDEPARTA